MRSLSPVRLKRTLLTGLFIVGPFGLTFIVLAWIVSLIDAALAPLVGLIGRPIPGLGLVVGFLLVLAAGVVADNMVGQHLLEYAEDLALKIPVFNWLYRTIKQVSEVFSPSAKGSFRGVVLVEYPRPSCYSLGFVTNELSLETASGPEKLVCVYVPTNHMYIGDYILVPARQVITTQLTQQEGIQAAISAGAALPPVIRGQARAK